ncbi:MAG: BlaI/MecI/CopY family transcriptional regulator [Bacteroidetes bacterium]|jgi:predicted transcriptional regulator|nr:BlaI/MecI/CopY family transcriptional regulator [Bacteroidota bacterium]MBL0019718.1 BlaI/MecI/CopY family transcriptional regulator [Bacteroidota bacterium]
MKKLTRAEEEMMLVLWKLNKAFLKDIIASYPEPRPNQSTVSTILRTLEKKGFARHTAYSKTFEYYPTVPKRAYSRIFFNDFLEKYFGGSYEELVAFLSSEMALQLRVPEEVATEKTKVQKPVEQVENLAQLSLF